MLLLSKRYVIVNLLPALPLNNPSSLRTLLLRVSALLGMDSRPFLVYPGISVRVQRGFAFVCHFSLSFSFIFSVIPLVRIMLIPFAATLRSLAVGERFRLRLRVTSLLFFICINLPTFYFT